MKIPMVDLQAQYLDIREAVDRAIGDVIASSAYIKGPFVERFEASLAALIGVPHCIGVGNGTDALVIALKGLGVGPGDEVITAVNTFVATPEAISLTGATPVFCEVEPETMTIDPNAIEKQLTDRTKAIVPVHLYGRIAAMGPILDLARKNGLKVVEDAAQAHGACLDGMAAGAFGHAATFSFYPGKNLGAYGDGGAIVTSDDDLADWARKFANHGRSTKYAHEFEGINSRLDGLQAAVLSVKLEHLNRWCELRREHARTYSRLLEGIEGVVCPKLPAGDEHVFHLFVIRAKRRDALRQHLALKGIATGIHYPRTMAELPAYRDRYNAERDFPIATEMRRQILSLPLYPEMTVGQIEEISMAVGDFYRQ